MCDAIFNFPRSRSTLDFGSNALRMLIRPASDPVITMIIEILITTEIIFMSQQLEETGESQNEILSYPSMILHQDRTS